jgi:hypothetical protein
MPAPPHRQGVRSAEGLIGMGFAYRAFVVAKEAMLHADMVRLFIASMLE